VIAAGGDLPPHPRDQLEPHLLGPAVVDGSGTNLIELVAGNVLPPGARTRHLQTRRGMSVHDSSPLTAWMWRGRPHDGRHRTRSDLCEATPGIVQTGTRDPDSRWVGRAPEPCPARGNEGSTVQLLTPAPVLYHCIVARAGPG